MRIPAILSAYLGRTFLSAFFTALTVIMGLTLLFDLIELLRRASGRPNADLLTLFSMALLKLPQMVHQLLPFAVMIGTMVMLWRLTRSAELVVARSAGVSVWQFLAPVLALVFILGVFNVTAFNPFAATLYARYEKMQDKLSLRRSNPLSLSESGLWLRENMGDGQVVMHAGSVRQEGFTLNMRQVSLFIFDGPDHFTRRIEAATGRLEDHSFRLQQVWIMEPGKASSYSEEMELGTSLTVTKIQENFSSPETLSFWKLPEFINFFEKSGFSASRHRLYFQSLLASPFLLCAMVLLASIFMLTPNLRSGGLMMRVAGSVGAGFTFYIFSKIIFALGLHQTLPLTLSAWCPPLIAALIAVSSLLHLEDG